MQESYEFEDELGHHVHPMHTGPFSFDNPLTCQACLDRLAAQRVQLMRKYGWTSWPIPPGKVDQNVRVIIVK